MLVTAGIHSQVADTLGWFPAFAEMMNCSFPNTD